MTKAAWFSRRRILGLLLVLGMAGASAAAPRSELVIVHTNDLHGYVFPRNFAGEQLPRERLGDRMGGLFSAATYVRQLRRRQAKVRGAEQGTLFLDAGDWYGGTLYGEHTGGVGVAEVMADSGLGLDATVLGNHAWDFGPQALDRFLGVLKGKVAVLGGNSRYKGKARLPSTKIFEVAGRRIGVVGLVTDGAMRAALPRKTKGWKVTSEFDELRRVLPGLRAQVDYVILLSHIGYGRDKKKAKALDELDDRSPELNVDLVVDGHSHRDEQLWADEDTFVVQADHYGLRLGVVTVPLLPNGKFGKPSANRVLMDAARYRPDRKMMRRHRRRIQERDKLEGRVAVPADAHVHIPHLLRTDTEVLASKMGDLVCAGFLHVAREEGHSPDLAIAYHGGVRAGMYSLADGDFTAGDLMAVSPFGGAVTVVETTGAKIRAAVLRRAPTTRGRASYGNAFLVAREDAKGRRKLVSFEVGGKPLKDDQRYTLVTDEFMATWFKGKGVKQTPLKVSPKEAVERLLQAERGNKPVDQALADRLAEPSALLKKGRR